MPYKNPLNRRAYGKRWRRSNGQYQSKYRLDNEKKQKAGYRERHAKKFGLTASEYDAFIGRAQGVCEGCGEPIEGPPRLDHCRQSGVNRGVLCNPCNLALGLMKDDHIRLGRLAEYARKHASTKEIPSVSQPGDPGKDSQGRSPKGHLNDHSCNIR